VPKKPPTPAVKKVPLHKVVPQAVKPAVKKSSPKKAVARSDMSELIETKVPSLGQPSLGQVVKPVLEASEKERVIYRYFECLVHAEQALFHLNKIGIIPPEVNGDLTTIMHRAKVDLESIKRKYQTVWGDMQP
jgi:hypothetical protein